MLEEEILSLLIKAKTEHRTLEMASEALGVSRSTFHAWLKGKGIHEQPLFKALNILGAHISLATNNTAGENSPPSEEAKPTATICGHGFVKQPESLRIEVLRAKNDGLEEQVRILSSANERLNSQIEKLQNQMDVMSAIISGLVNKKEACGDTVSNDLAKVI